MKTTQQKRPRINTKIVGQSTGNQKTIKYELEKKIPLERKYRFYGLDRTTPEIN